MGNFFNLDNQFFSILGKAWDILALSFLFLILCIPVITIGPAITALYYTIVKNIRRDHGYLTREFFHSFKLNFKNGVITGLILILLYIIIYFDYRFVNSLNSTYALIVKTIYNSLFIILLSMTIYIFPILSRFKVGIGKLFKTAIFMSIKHLPTTCLLILIVLIFGLACLKIPIFIIPLPGVCCLTCSYLIERVLKKYMPANDGEDKNSGEWYFE